MSPWTPDQLDRIAAADELRIAVPRDDGSLRRSLPIWAVRVGDTVYVRTWHRRDTGWFGRAVATGRAHVDVPGAAADVDVTDVGDGPEGRRDDVDAAYRAKYGRYGGSVASMVGDEAAASTLRLDPTAGRHSTA